jgi:hypothetical protein
MIPLFDLSDPVREAARSVHPRFRVKAAVLDFDLVEPWKGEASASLEPLGDCLVRTRLEGFFINAASLKESVAVEEISWQGLVTLSLRGNAGNAPLLEETLELRWLNRDFDPAQPGSMLRVQRTVSGLEGGKPKQGQAVTECTALPATPASGYLAALEGLAYPVVCSEIKESGREMSDYVYFASYGIMIEMRGAARQGAATCVRLRAIRQPAS